MLGVLTPEQDEAKKKDEEHFNPKMKKSSLDQFFYNKKITQTVSKKIILSLLKPVFY